MPLSSPNAYLPNSHLHHSFNESIFLEEKAFNTGSFGMLIRIYFHYTMFL